MTPAVVILLVVIPKWFCRHPTRTLFIFSVIAQQKAPFHSEDIGDQINKVLEKIEEANKEKLQGVFRNIDFNSEAALGQTKQRNTRLDQLLQDFSHPKLDLRPSRTGNMDIIGNAYEYLIARFAAGAGKKAGEFYTPAEVSELLAELLDPQPGERICDPACGSGSLLIKCGLRVLNKGSKDFALYGQENNGSTWALAKMNMFLHGMDGAVIEWGDTLRDPRLIEKDTTMKFEVVVANPPFSLDKWGHDKVADDPYNRFHRGLPPKSKADYAFISHMVETITEEQGRVGVIVPHGVLFRGGSEGRIRRQLIEENLLESVIGLPANLFYGTGIPTCILIFNRNKKRKNILFIDASECYEDLKGRNKLRKKDIKKIVTTYKKRKTVEYYSIIVSNNEIRNNDYNLNIPRYVDTYREETIIDLNKLQKEILKIEDELSIVKNDINKYLDELGI